MSRRALAILIASAAFQAALAAIPDTMGDLLEYRSWTRELTRSGLAAAYWPQETPNHPPQVGLPIDYPPLLPYLFWAVGRAVLAFSPEALESNDRLLDFLIRLPLIASSVLLALLVYLETRRTAPGAALITLP